MKINNQWDEKYLREQPFMPFGSLLNAYAQMHQQKPLTLNRFINDARMLFAFSRELVLDALESSQPKPEEVPNEEKIKIVQEFQKRYNMESAATEQETELKQAEEKLPIIEIQ
jgi:hypothetical protein